MLPAPTPNLPAFGPRLRKMRRAAGVKQSALSHALGVDQSSVSRWEAGSQLPDDRLQRRAFELLSEHRTDDFALRRLVETSTLSLYLVEDATHECLAYSSRRAAEWEISERSLNGTHLWRFATEEIQSAEATLEQSGWWSSRLPEPRCLRTSARRYDELTILAGYIRWERMYLNDGTPVRLCTSSRQVVMHT